MKREKGLKTRYVRQSSISGLNLRRGGVLGEGRQGVWKGHQQGEQNPEPLQ